MITETEDYLLIDVDTREPFEMLKFTDGLSLDNLLGTIRDVVERVASVMALSDGLRPSTIAGETLSIVEDRIVSETPEDDQDMVRRAVGRSSSRAMELIVSAEADVAGVDLRGELSCLSDAIRVALSVVETVAIRLAPDLSRVRDA
ncbi:hypothetical protein ACFO0N_07295 [Halobium salinum]|uniref:Uncharacterized protein n=1 Tax=Halobium salinum TaxID=1364940 RepID=A0ABD5PA34_9EURY|nr:hypothetical protein [Halobium salinum]